MRNRTSAIGLVIESSHIAAAQVTGAPGRITVSRIAIVDRADEPSTDNPAALSEHEAERLLGVLTRRGFTGRKVAISASSPTLVTGMLELPPVASGAPVAQLASGELARVHRMEPSSLEVGVWELPPLAAGRGEPTTLVMGCPCGPAIAMVEPLEAAGFDVAAIEAHPAALARVLPAGEGFGVVIDLASDAAHIALCLGGELIYVRSIATCGIASLERRLAGEHGLSETVMRHVLEDVGVKTRKPDAVGRAARGIESWALEVATGCQRAIDYATGLYSSSQTGRIVVVGVGALIPGVSDLIVARSGLEAEQPRWEAAREEPRLACAIAIAGRFDA